MDREYTSEQQAAIDTRDCDLLVSAAAGSGKTAVLIERLIQMMVDQEKPVELDRLLVVTFTDAAAQEMRQRLGEALRERLEKDPSDAHLQRQMILLPKASIMTIHSFCLQVVRSHFAQLGIDPSFRVADGTEMELLKQELMSALFEQLYEDEMEDDALAAIAFSEGGKADFHRLVEFYGNAVKDDSLQELALSLYEFSRSKPWPEEWLIEQAESFRVTTVAEMEQAAWYVFFRQEAGAVLAELAAELEEALELAQNPNIHVGYVELLNDELNMVLLAARGLETGLDAFIRAMEDVVFGRLPGAKSKTQDGTMTEDGIKALKESIQGLRNDVKDRLLDLKKRAAFKPAVDMLADMNDLYGVMRALAGVVNAFAEKFGQEKRRRNLVDFSDFEHLCLEVLLEEGSTEDNPIPSAAAQVLQEKYAEICVDEYQDSNLVQELILLSVSRKGRGEPNRFMVGDMKQSIYRFRMANPDLFRQKYAAYSREKGSLERVIGLSKNFRSRDGVLDCINFIFRQTMDEALGDVEYDEHSMLYFGAKYYPAYVCEVDCEAEMILVESEAAKTEGDGDASDIEGADEGERADSSGRDDGLNVLAELTNAEAEARAVAVRINELVNGDEPMQVSERGGGTRPAAYRDIVVLLRSPGVVGGAYAEEMRRLEIPSFAGSTKGYFEATEVLTVLGLLQIIDNPRQDLHLITVLHSPLYGFTADELVAVRACSDGLFYDAVLAAAESDRLDAGLRERLTAFCTQLEDWRNRAVMTPVSAMLWALYGETGYYRLVGTMAGGNVRCANLTALFERAVQYEKTSLKGLFHFIRYIERLQKSGQELSDAKVVGENENVVRVMSVHKSKGLEFPIVFVCGLGRKFNVMDTQAAFVMHAELGFGPKHIDLENRVASNTLKRYAVSLRILRENLSEELRLLYVALTRAKEKLILTAAVKSVAKEREKLLRSVRAKDLLLPNAVRLRASRFVDWILPALARHRDMMVLADGIKPVCEAAWNDASRWRLSIVSKAASEAAALEENASVTERMEALCTTDMQADYSGQREAVVARLHYHYETLNADEIPSKLSVSEIKRMHYAAVMEDSASLFDGQFEQGYVQEDGVGSSEGEGERRMSNLRVPKMISGDTAPNAARRGTLLHTVLEYVDFEQDVTETALDARVADLLRRGFIREDELPFIDRPAILAFMQSEVASRIRRSDDVRREVRFTSSERPHDINPEWDETIASRIVVHGVIDLMFREGDAFVLVDYKTDRFAPEALDAVVDRYRPQLQLYRNAIQKFSGQPVSESILYFFNRQIAKSVEV